MPRENRFVYAVLSSVAYKANLQDKYKQLKKYGLNRDYYILKQYTNRDITTFYDFIDSKVVVSFRGTDNKNLLNARYEDLMTDYQLAIGRLRLTDRFQEAKDMLNKIIDKYGKGIRGKNSNIILTGHSLGGAIADYLSDIYKLPAFLFNTGSSPISVINNPIPTRYTTGNFDILSFSDKLYNQSIIGSKGGHGIKDFIKRGKM